MFGFDFTRPPHPAALAVVSPFISGAVFLMGVAYFRWNDVVKMVTDPNVPNTAKVVTAVIISYALGLLLSTVVSIPFLICYLGGFIIAYTIIAIQRRSQQDVEPSKQAPFRRAVQAAFDPALIPSSAEEYATQFTQRFVAKITANTAAIDEGARQKIQQEAVKLFTDHHDLQWKHIHRTLYKVESRKYPQHELLGFEPIVTIASTILIWEWLSFKIPAPLHIAAIITLVFMGVMLFSLGVMKTTDYVDGISIQAFLFEEMLGRRRPTAKSED